MGEQLKNLKCIKQRIISGFFRTINNEFHGFRLLYIIITNYNTNPTGNKDYFQTNVTLDPELRGKNWLILGWFCSKI